MLEITTVGLDLAKTVFVAFGASSIQVHWADVSGRPVLRKKLRWDQVLAFFCQLPRCVVAMEACGGAHFASRTFGSGAVRSESWAMRCGSSRPPT
jgi:transposase